MKNFTAINCLTIWPSSCLPGRSGIPAPASRCSARRAPRAPSKRRSPTPRRCTGSPGSRPPSHCTSRGTSSTTSPRWAATPHEHGVGLGTINSNTFQDDDYKFGSLTHTDKNGAAEGHRSSPRLHRGHERDRIAGSEDLARRRHQLPRPGRHPRPPGPPRRIAVDDLPAHRPRAANGARVQVLRTGHVHDRCSGLGHVVRPGQRTRRTGNGVPRHRPPRPRHQHRVHRRAAAPPRKAGLVRLQLALLRRRRPDRRGR